MSRFEVFGPDWLTGEPTDWRSCETCGHWSSFDAGFEYNEGGYVRGWYENEISCYNWVSYDSWLYNEFQDDWDSDKYDGSEDFDTAERFREFLTETDSEEAQQILDELNRLGL